MPFLEDLIQTFQDYQSGKADEWNNSWLRGLEKQMIPERRFAVPELQQYEEPNSWAQPWLRDILNSGGPDVNLTPIGDKLFGGGNEDRVREDPTAPPDPLAVTRAAAQESIGRKRDEAASAEKTAADQAALEKLIEAGKRASAQRDFIAGETPLYEDYDKGIAVSSSRTDMAPEDILWKIRAEAAAKGRRGSLRGGTPNAEDIASTKQARGGGFSYAPDSPEIRQREMERARFISEQPLRDATYAAQLAEQRGDTEGAAAARKSIADLQMVQQESAKNKLAEAIVNQLGGESGIIPRNQFNQLRMAGVPVPYSAAGEDPGDARAYIARLLDYEDRSMSRFDPVESMTNPMVQQDMKGSSMARRIMQDALQRIDAGGEPTSILQQMQQELIALSQWNMQQKEMFAGQMQSALMPQEGE